MNPIRINKRFFVFIVTICILSVMTSLHLWFHLSNVYKNRPIATICDQTKCKLPKCLCAGTEIPGGLKRNETPQFVYVTFDDSVGWGNVRYYTKIFSPSRKNPNGCRIHGTFFVSHWATNYEKVRELHSYGHEIGDHAVTHRFPQSFMKHASYEDWRKEIEEQRNNINQLAGIPKNEILGFRAPFLQLGGDNQFAALKDLGFLYESSRENSRFEPPVWPYTLEYNSSQYQDCRQPPCPVLSYPGLWEIPMVSLKDMGAKDHWCAMIDNRWCDHGGSYHSLLKMFKDNFERHYSSNRAPFPIFIHSEFLDRNEYAVKAIEDFLDHVLAKGDVYVTTISEFLTWIRDPVSVKQISNWISADC